MKLHKTLDEKRFAEPGGILAVVGREFDIPFNFNRSCKIAVSNRCFKVNTPASIEQFPNFVELKDFRPSTKKEYIW